MWGRETVGGVDHCHAMPLPLCHVGRLSCCRPPPRRAVSAWLEMPFVRIAQSPTALPLVTTPRRFEVALLKGDLLRRWATCILIDGSGPPWPENGQQSTENGLGRDTRIRFLLSTFLRVESSLTAKTVGNDTTQLQPSAVKQYIVPALASPYQHGEHQQRCTPKHHRRSLNDVWNIQEQNDTRCVADQ